MARTCFVAEVTLWIKSLSNLLHQGNAWRLAPLLWGLLFARGRRTVACWLLIAVRNGATFADWEGAMTSCLARRIGRQQGGVAMVNGRSVHRRREGSDRICLSI